MPTLSLAMITKNEAASLAHCLASVRDLVDEMVVVDTGSSDGTVAIAESFGARIGRFPWCDDFAAARNESLRLCTGDWVLVLDADEAVDPLDHARIRAAIAPGKGRKAVPGFLLVSRNYNRDWSAKVFDQPVLVNRSPYAEGAEFPFYADMPVFRLFRRFPDLRFEGRIHERADPYLRRKHLPIGNLDAVIHHYGKLDPAAEKAKKAYYLELAERDLADDPRDADRQFFVMAQADLLGQWEKVLAAGLAIMRIRPKVIPFVVPLTIARAYQELGRHQEAVPWFAMVLKGQPGHPLALCRLPLSLEALGRGEEGRPLLARAMAAHPEDPTPCLVLAELEERAGRVAEARAAVRAAIERNPGDPRLRQGLIELDLKHGMGAQAAADAMEALRALPDQGAGDWHALAASFLLRAGHGGPGKAVLELGLAAFPQHRGLGALAAEATPPPASI
jgi:glycosyltransferase involved in cell wall biosynthesis